MLEPEFIKYLASLGVGGIIAGFMFMFYRKDVKTFTDQWKGQSEALMSVVKDNTVAITSNTKTIEALHQRDDDLHRALTDLGGEMARAARIDRTKI